MNKKIVLMFICIVITGFMVITSQRIAVRADGMLPTTAPAEETIISQADAYATLTAVPTMIITQVPYPVPSEVSNPTENPYPEPQSVSKSRSLKEILTSIFGSVLSNGKQSSQKK